MKIGGEDDSFSLSLAARLMDDNVGNRMARVVGEIQPRDGVRHLAEIRFHLPVALRRNTFRAGGQACDMVAQVVAKPLQVSIDVLQFLDLAAHARNALFEQQPFLLLLLRLHQAPEQSHRRDNHTEQQEACQRQKEQRARRTIVNQHQRGIVRR